jgi:hypothetical protein
VIVTAEGTPSPVTTDPRELVSPDLFARLVGKIVSDEQVSSEYAGRIMGQALAFLMACAQYPGAQLSPSQPVDIGWHTFVLHTAEYSEFCQRVAGRFIHHVPDDDTTAPLRSAVTSTVAAIRATGAPVDEELWRLKSADCSQCHAGCHDSP